MGLFSRRPKPAPSPVRVVGARDSIYISIDRRWLQALDSPGARRLLTATDSEDGGGDWGGADYRSADLDDMLREAVVEVLTHAGRG